MTGVIQWIWGDDSRSRAERLAEHVTIETVTLPRWCAQLSDQDLEDIAGELDRLDAGTWAADLLAVEMDERYRQRAADLGEINGVPPR